MLSVHDKPNLYTMLSVFNVSNLYSSLAVKTKRCAVGSHLVKQAHPDWSASMAKSALMTTAWPFVLREDGVTPATPFDQGAGHLNPTPAVDPGLVYDAGFFDWLAFLCGNNPANISQGTCDFLASQGYSFDPSDLNQASIAIGQLAGLQTVQRTVTNVGPAATYDVSVVAPPGIDVIVSPSSLTLNTGESAGYSVTFTTTPGAALNQYAFGELTWNHGSHSVRSPIAVMPVPLAAPDEVMGTGTDGSESFDVVFGYSGAYAPQARGLVPADMQPNNVVDDPASDIDTALVTGMGITWHTFEVPAGTLYARFSLFDAYTDGNDDLDLYIWGPGGDTSDLDDSVGLSGTATSEEEVNVENPDPGTYTIAVHGWETDGPDANYVLFNWAFGPDAGNMTASGPGSASVGATGTVDVTWSGLTAGTKYLGAVEHTDGSSSLGLTVVRVDTD
jgi:hypothetical protein